MLLSFINNGQGQGKRYLLLWAFLSVFLICLMGVGMLKTDVIPYINTKARELSSIVPIEVKGGQIISPVNTLKTIHVDVQGMPVAIMIDTRQDELDLRSVSTNEPAIILTRKFVYMITNKIEVRSLKGLDFKITKQMIDAGLIPENILVSLWDKAKSVVIGFYLVWSIIAFVGYLILMVLLGLLSGVLEGLIKAPKMDFSAKCRLATLCILIVGAGQVILRPFWAISGLSIFIAYLLCEVVFLCLLKDKA